jgi:hypothetical protein
LEVTRNCRGSSTRLSVDVVKVNNLVSHRVITATSDMGIAKAAGQASVAPDAATVEFEDHAPIRMTFRGR